MRTFFATLFLSALTALAGYYPTPQNPGAVQVVGIESRNGGLSYVSLDGVVVNVNSNDFSVVDGTLFSKGLANGGTYTVTNINLNPFFTANPAFFVTNSRVILASVPSFYKGIVGGGFDNDGGLSPPMIPTVQLSKDGGANWFNATATNVPVLVSLYSTSGHHSGATNLTVTAFVNATAQGQTNDVTGQVLLVSQTVDSRSVVNVTGAGQIAASAASQWSAYSAVSAVDLGGHNLKFNPTWSVTFTNTTLRYTAGGTDIFTLTPGTTTGTAPVINTITLTTTNVTLAITAPSTPTVQTCPDLAAHNWVTLSGQTVTSVGGSWYVSAPLPAGTNAFFRAYCSANAGSGIAYVNGILKLAASTNAPAITGTDAAIWNSNKVLYAVSSTKTNLLLDLR